MNRIGELGNTLAIVILFNYVYADTQLMWDADLVSRVRDRKLNEIMIFASMAKIDSSNIDTYIDLIVSLGDDIDACDTLLDTDGDAEIALETIDAPEYVNRLSPGEKSDEDAFNSMKVSPYCDESIPEDIHYYVRQLISEAVESLKSDNTGVSKDAFDAVKEELGIVRQRNEELSKDLDFRMTECASVSEELAEVKRERDTLQGETEILRKRVSELEAAAAQIDSMSESLSEANEKVALLEAQIEELQSEVSEKDSEITAVETEMEAIVEDNSELVNEVQALNEDLSETESEMAAAELLHEAEESMVEGDASPEAVDTGDSNQDAVQEVPAEGHSDEDARETVPVVDRILTDAQREIVEATKAMKDSKIDEFIDLSMDGKMDETICDNVVSFLKVDVSICEALLGMGCTSLDGILDGFRKILSIIDDAPEPRSQSVYSNSLTPEQSVIEYGYNKVIEHIQDVMLRRYANLI